MNYYSKTVYFVHDLYPLVTTIQLHQQIMESQPSTSTTTSTTSEHDNMPSSQSTSVDKTSTASNTNPTLFIPNPTYSPLIQQHVTNAAAMIASNHLTRNMFIVEVFKKCSEIALWEKRTGKTAPELLPESPKPPGESPHSSHSYSSDVQYITPEGDDVLNRYIKKYSMPKISTDTVTVSSTFGDERSPVNQDIQDEIIGVAPKTTTEEAGFSSAELSVSYKTTAKPESLYKQSLHSRDSSKLKSTTQKEVESITDDTPMDLEVDTKEDECRIPLGTPKKKNRGIWLYCTSSTGKLYSFKYFKAYPHDHRMLLNDDYGEPIKCHCPEGKIHHVQCPWYHPDVIYIIDFQEDLSSIELAAQQKIYNIYQNTIHNPPEHCGCGTAAEIAYMGHTTGCFKFKYIHERESYEVLLAILKKRKKVSFAGGPANKIKRPRLQSPKCRGQE